MKVTKLERCIKSNTTELVVGGVLGSINCKKGCMFRNAKGFEVSNWVLYTNGPCGVVRIPAD